jgi:2-polyprenyl-3-methyl-5-hydroxy-6-metoxy-1,4-benzoquinol methylase
MSGFENPADVWNNRYSNTEYVFGTEPNHFLVESAEYLQSGMEALLVADGEGRNSIWLAQQGIDVTAFDISEVAIKKAKHLARENEVQVQFSVSNCENWQWHEKKYDLVVAIFIQFADPHARERLFANMIDSLKPGGTFILQGYTPKQLEYKTGGPPLIDHLYSEEHAS